MYFSPGRGVCASKIFSEKPKFVWVFWHLFWKVRVDILGSDPPPGNLVNPCMVIYMIRLFDKPLCYKTYQNLHNEESILYVVTHLDVVLLQITFKSMWMKDCKVIRLLDKSLCNKTYQNIYVEIHLDVLITSNYI